MGSSIESINPSSNAIPTRADIKDFATDHEICFLDSLLSSQ